MHHALRRPWFVGYVLLLYIQKTVVKQKHTNFIFFNLIIACRFFTKTQCFFVFCIYSSTASGVFLYFLLPGEILFIGIFRKNEHL